MLVVNDAILIIIIYYMIIFSVNLLRSSVSSVSLYTWVNSRVASQISTVTHKSI